MAESAHLAHDPMAYPAAVASYTIEGMPNIQYETLARDGWIAYAVLSAMSDHLSCSIPATFELAAHNPIIATIKRGSDPRPGKPLSMKLTGYPALEEQP